MTAVPEIAAAQDGKPTLRLADEYLEDAVDPDLGAKSFAKSADFGTGSDDWR